MAAPTTSRPITPDSNPPRTYFSVWQRLFRGYGPLAVFAILLVVMALLVPSKVPSSSGNLGQNSNLAAGSGSGANQSANSGSGNGSLGAGSTGAGSNGGA